MSSKGKGGGARLVNHLRASISHGRGRSALAEVRSSANPSQYRSLVATAFRVPNRGRYPLLPGFEKDARGVLTLEPLKPLDARRELDWCVTILERHTERLYSFLQETTGLQSQLLAGDEIGALQTINKIHDSFGISAWTVQAKIALLQAVEGQEAQKSFASEIHRENSGLLRGIAHLASQRNEGPVGIAGFKLRALETIDGWDIPDSWVTYLKYVLLGEIPETDLGIIEILTTASTGTCVDLATAFIDLAAVNRNRLVAHNAQAMLRLDQLLSRVNPLNEGLLESILSESRTGASTSGAAPLTLRRAIGCMSSIFNRGADAAEKHEDIEKISLNFSFAPLFRILGRISRSVVFEPPLRVSALQGEAQFLLHYPALNLWGGESGGGSRSERLLSELESLWGEGDANALLAICSDLDGGDSFDIAMAAKSRFSLHLATGDWQAAIEVAIACISRFPGSRYEFRFADAVKDRSWGELKGSQDPIIAALAVSYAISELPSGRHAQRLHRHLQQLALLVLRASGSSQFSELFAGEMTSVRRQFLSDVCSETVIEVNINLDSSKALAAERMKICQRLVQHDPGNSSKYLEEIRQLTYAAELEEGIRHFDSSRLFVNEVALQEWGVRSLSEDYARYKLLQGASLPELEDIQAAAVLVLRDRDSPVPQALLEQPRSEADRLLLELSQRVMREFLYGSTTGLNSYLSLRIRHGSLAGHLRGPLEEAGAIALRDSKNGIYQPISAWQDISADLSVEAVSGINSAFDEFSRKFDARVSRFVDELLQIRSEGKPEGMFDIQVSTLHLNILKAQAVEIKDPQEFVKACILHFKALLAPAMEEVKRHISQIKDEVDRDADILLDHIHRESAAGRLAPLLDSIHRGRTNFNVAADRVSDWFSSLDRADHERRYSLDQIIRIGQTLTANTRPTFAPELRVNLGDGIPPFTPQFGAFVIADAMFIAFDNAFLHSRMEGRLGIDVRANLIEDKMLVFEVENDVADDAETPSSVAKLEKIRGHLESGEYRNMVSSEGGTGLFKLKRLAERSGASDDVTFGFSNGRFIVRFSIPIRSIELEENDDE